MATRKTGRVAKKIAGAPPAAPGAALKLATHHVGGEPGDLPLADLRFDRLNPRLPIEAQSDDQDVLLKFIVNEYSPIEIARSIASHGYFASEPLIVVTENGNHVVVEGNRRLAALRLLKNPSWVKSLELSDATEWATLGQRVNIPDTVPVVRATSRESVAPIIGYRHISGIEPWDPIAKARFLASLVDTHNKTFEEVATLVGESRTTVAAHYRNFRIEKQAREDFKLDTSRAQKRFGVFTRAMQDDNVRSFLDAPQPGKVKPGEKPLPSGASSRMKEFLSWAFGDDVSAPVSTDSRKIKELGVAITSKDGLAVLRKRRDLGEAFIAAGGVKRRVLENLQEAEARLSAALDDIKGLKGDTDIQGMVAACQKVVAELQKKTS